MNTLLAASDAIANALRRLAHWSGWLLIVLMCVTCVDVVCRKLGIPIPYTVLQEMEWHLHTAIFSLWMGFNYVLNAHPRVDSYTERLPSRTRAWIELAGCVLLALPYVATVFWYGMDFVATAYDLQEGSDSAVGIPYRWIIKWVMVAGFALVIAGIVSVLLRVVVVLWGARDAEEVGLRIGHSASEV